jgi:hypothetical protein
MFFIPLERSWSVDVQNGLAWAIWTYAAQVMGKRRTGSQTGSLTLVTKSRESARIDVSRWSATWCWKAFEEGYKFDSDRVPIEGRGEELWSLKVPRVQTGTVLGLHLGSLGKKCHLDVTSAGECREDYMGEGGGFPQFRAVVSQVSPRLPVACPNTKRM